MWQYPGVPSADQQIQNLWTGSGMNQMSNCYHYTAHFSEDDQERETKSSKSHREMLTAQEQQESGMSGST